VISASLSPIKNKKESRIESSVDFFQIITGISGEKKEN
jgi:hypothetical protein